jgi:hypothetical protein
MDLAERSAQKGQRLDLSSQYPRLHLIMANILSRKNDEPGSLAEMRQYLKAAPNAEDAAQVRSRMEEKEKIIKAASK